jgi:hypothetical protein
MCVLHLSHTVALITKINSETVNCKISQKFRFELFFLQEIHPVKVADISYVTGDTCTDKEILQQERAILKVTRK